jgi:integrase/recombinase XerD
MELIKAPAERVTVRELAAGTRATTDRELVASWIDNLSSPHSRRNFEATALRFLEALQIDLRQAKVEDVRQALSMLIEGRSAGTSRQYVLRVKSLLGYAHRLGYTTFNASAVLKVKAPPRGAELAKRIMPEVDVALLIRAARTARDRVLLEVAYGGGLRVSELVALTWADVLSGKGGRAQLSITGKGSVVRQVLLPKQASEDLLALRGDARPNDPVFPARHGGRLTERAVLGLVKRLAKRAGVSEAVSPHWLRHAHGSHALDRGATLAEVQATLGHANVATTSGYLHARPDSSSGLKLDPGIFR